MLTVCGWTCWVIGNKKISKNSSLSRRYSSHKKLPKTDYLGSPWVNSVHQSASINRMISSKTPLEGFVLFFLEKLKTNCTERWKVTRFVPKLHQSLELHAIGSEFWIISCEARYSRYTLVNRFPDKYRRCLILPQKVKFCLKIAVSGKFPK